MKEEEATATGRASFVILLMMPHAHSGIRQFFPVFAKQLHIVFISYSRKGT